VHHYLRGSRPRDVFIEVVDVGGHRKYDSSRCVFYNNVCGAWSAASARTALLCSALRWLPSLPLTTVAR
jgi:hypothetical protein